MIKLNQFFSSFLLAFALFSCTQNVEKPRVFVFTDINIDSGDPDDRQSLIHLLWYADELKIEGIVPERWSAKGLEACQLALEAYDKDYQTFGFKKRNYPTPQNIKTLFATDTENAKALFQKAAFHSKDPLYVLIWGNMNKFGEVLKSHPDLVKNIRVISIGTNLMMEEHQKYIPAHWEKMEKPCEQYNWNGHGRNEIFNKSQFIDMWWLEINWTYEGMFLGDEPKEMFEKLLKYGSLGNHMKEVVKNESWANYFRVGDTPSVLYVIDPNNDLDDPTKGSWAGKFYRPFPADRPNYFTDYNGPVEWDYSNPCNTWENHIEMNAFAKKTLLDKREEMYTSLLKKLDQYYPHR
jgi:hypothetical protein